MKTIPGTITNPDILRHFPDYAYLKPIPVKTFTPHPFDPARLYPDRAFPRSDPKPEHMFQAEVAKAMDIRTEIGPEDENWKHKFDIYLCANAYTPAPKDRLVYSAFVDALALEDSFDLVVRAITWRAFLGYSRPQHYTPAKG